MQQTQALLRARPALASNQDAELIGRIAAGDRAALADLYVLHQRPVFRYICQITSDRGMAEEILQDTLLAVWQSAATFEQRSTVRLWLLGIARRQAHNTMRRRHLPQAEVEDLDQIADQGASPEGLALAQFDREQIARAVSQLPMPQRETLSLVLVEGLSYRDAAEVLGVPEGTVKSRLNKARLTLRITLGSRAEVES